MNSPTSVFRRPLAILRPRLDAFAEVLAFAHRLHAAGARDLDELPIVGLSQPIDRLLAAGHAPEQQTA